MSALPFDSATYAVELEAKANRLRELLAPFDAPEPQVFDSPLKHFRLRAEFRLWREGGERHYAMFAQDDHIELAVGRDYADVAPIDGVLVAKANRCGVNAVRQAAAPLAVP